MAYIMSNEAYTGMFRWSGKAYRGTYQPIIPEDLFDRVQRILGDASRSKTHQHTFAYAGVCRCGACGGLLTGQVQKGRYVYYACRGAADCKRYYPEAMLDAAAVDVIRSLQIDEARSEWIVRELARWYDDGSEKEAARADRVRARLSEIAHLRAASYEDKLLGRVPEDTWSAINDRWKAEEVGLRDELAALKPTIERAAFLRASRDPFELLQDAATQYLRRDAAEKGRLLRTCCSNLVVTDGNVSIQLRSPFHIIAKMAGSTDWLASVDEYRTAILMMAAARAA
jgi:site-specific DNA recombinase